MQEVLYAFEASFNTVTLKFQSAIADGLKMYCSSLSWRTRRDISRVGTDFGFFPPTVVDRRRAIREFKYENRQRQSSC